MRVPDAEREPSAVVGTLEVRVPARHTVDQDVLGSVEQPFDLPRDVRVQGFDLLCLLLLDRRLTCRRLRLLRDDRRRRSTARATTVTSLHIQQRTWLTNLQSRIVASQWTRRTGPDCVSHCEREFRSLSTRHCSFAPRARQRAHGPAFVMTARPLSSKTAAKLSTRTGH